MCVFVCVCVCACMFVCVNIFGRRTCVGVYQCVEESVGVLVDGCGCTVRVRVRVPGKCGVCHGSMDGVHTLTPPSLWLTHRPTTASSAATTFSHVCSAGIATSPTVTVLRTGRRTAWRCASCWGSEMKHDAGSPPFAVLCCKWCAVCSGMCGVECVALWVFCVSCDACCTVIKWWSGGMVE